METMDFWTQRNAQEMYGVSNNVMNYGPPQWKDAQFEAVEQNQSKWKLAIG